MTISIDKVTIDSALDIYQIMNMVLKREHKLDRDRPHFWVMALNHALRILNLELVAFGANNMLKVRAADILAIPLQKQAQKLILIHNHPSGNIKPSQEEKDFTDKMIQACNLMNISLFEHIIITKHSYFSFADTGLIEQLEESTKYLLSYELERKLHEELQEARKEIEIESKIKIKKSLKKGRQEGLEEGIAKGIEEGEKKGRKKGRLEGREEEKLEIAKQMLKDGESIEKIKKWTGLSKQRIGSL